MPVLPGFDKGQSDNLSKLNSMTMFGFLGSNPDFIGTEIRGVKATRSGRESYGDSAVGYIQVKRDRQICTVKARVTPEHRIRDKAYNVTLVCDELDENIISVQCHDCAASLGGCKHAIALMAWLHRRSEEPSVTSVSCYWKPSKLSAVGKSLQVLKGKTMGKKETVPLIPNNGTFFNAVLQQSKTLGLNNTMLTNYYKKSTNVMELSIHFLISEFFQNKFGMTSDEFLSYISSQISEEICFEASKQTIGQSESSLWYELRYGRVTASKAHESSHCRTSGGSLVETILGARRLKDTAAIKRGRELEGEVRKEIEKKMVVKIQLGGFLTSPEFPFMSTSPDGISDKYIIEIKCPFKEKSLKNYIVNDEITPKYYAQIQTQMLFFKKSQGLFCVAHPNFETTKEISVLMIDFDATFCADLVNNCKIFWKREIFSELQKDFVY